MVWRASLSEKITLIEVITISTTIIEKLRNTISRLSETANIVRSPVFDSAILKIEEAKDLYKNNHDTSEVKHLLR